MPLIPACETLRSKDYKSEVNLSCTESPYVKKVISEEKADTSDTGPTGIKVPG